MCIIRLERYWERYRQMMHTTISRISCTMQRTTDKWKQSLILQIRELSTIMAVFGGGEGVEISGHEIFW